MNRNEDSDDEDATRMMSREPEFVGDEEPDPDATVPITRGAAFAQYGLKAKAQKNKAQPVFRAQKAPPHFRPNADSSGSEMTDTGEMTLPRNRSDLPLSQAHRQFGDTGELTLPRTHVAPPPPLPLPPPAYQPPPNPSTGRGSVPPSYRAPDNSTGRGSVPPPASFRPAAPSMPMIPNLPGLPNRPVFPNAHGPQNTPPPPSMPVPASAPVPQNMPMQANAPMQANSPMQANAPMQTNAPMLTNGPMPPSVPMPSSRPAAFAHPPSERALAGGAPASRPMKVRSPNVFVGVMVSCTILTMTGLALLVYLKMKGLW